MQMEMDAAYIFSMTLKDGLIGVDEVANEEPWGHDTWDGRQFWDDVSGKPLDLEVNQAARREELEFVEGKPLYEIVDRAEAIRVTGRPPISTKWVDIDKGNGVYRSRWVGRQFTDGTDQGEYFAATPPWEAVKALISIAASQKGIADNQGRRKWDRNRERAQEARRRRRGSSAFQK